MSESTALIRRGYALFNAGDYEGWLAMFHPDVVLVVSGIFPGFEPHYRAREGLSRFLDTMLEAWDRFHVEPKEIVERDDYVAVNVELHATGRESGVNVELNFHHAFRIDDGLIVRWASYPTRGEALEAVGLRS